MSDKLCDIDYIKNFDQLIGEKYETAKKLCSEAPIQTLVLSRAMLASICEMLVDEYAVTENNQSLHDTILLLHSEKVLNRSEYELFEKIRKAGNRGAHPEQFNLTNEDYAELALSSLKVLCDLVQTIRLRLFGRSEPAYYFEEEVESSFKDLSFNVLFEDDADAKFKVSIALMAKHRQQVAEYFSPDKKGKHFVYFDEKGLTGRALDLLEEAAISRHIEAMYEYGLVLANGQGREKNIDEAIGYFAMAAAQGNINAKAYYGLFVFEQETPHELDVESALAELKVAAQSDNPIALHTLAALCSQGRYLKQSSTIALSLLKKAAELGFPCSQYELAVYYRDVEQEYELCKQNLIAAAENGYYPANLALARLIAFRASSEEDYRVAADNYRLYLKHNDCPEARFELSELLRKCKDLDTHLLKQVLHCHIFSYRHEQCPDHVAKRIESLSLKLLKQLINEFEKREPGAISTKEFSETLANYDRNGIPFKDPTKLVEVVSTFSSDSFMVQYMLSPERKTVPIDEVKPTGPYDICPICHSGKYFKDCCGWIFNRNS